MKVMVMMNESLIAYYNVPLKFSRAKDPEAALLKYIQTRVLEYFDVEVWIPSLTQHVDGSFTVYIYGAEHECLRWFSRDYNDGREFSQQIPDINLRYRCARPSGLRKG